MTTPTEIMERLKALPSHLAATERRFYVEAISDETKAPLIEYYALEAEAEAEAQVWAKRNGADGFYPPRDGGHPVAFSFKKGSEPTAGGAWNDAGRNYVPAAGCVAKSLSKRPAGKKLRAEVEALPAFPTYREAMAHLGRITDLRAGSSGSGVGFSDSKMHFAVPFEINDRYFINAVNHNYDILRQATQAAEYLAGEHPEWARSLDYEGDPIGWRPEPGWAFITKVEVEFLIAEENMRRAAKRAAA